MEVQPRLRQQRVVAADHLDVVHLQLVGPQLDHSVDHLVQLLVRLLRLVAARERQEVLHDPLRPHRLVVDPLQVLARLGIELALQQQLGKPHDAAQGIVELVRHARDQQADRRHLLRLHELRLHGQEASLHGCDLLVEELLLEDVRHLGGEQLQGREILGARPRRVAGPEQHEGAHLRRPGARQRHVEHVARQPRPQAAPVAVCGGRQVRMADPETLLDDGRPLAQGRLVAMEVVDLLVGEAGEEELHVPAILIEQRQDRTAVEGVLAYRVQEEATDGIEIVFLEDAVGGVAQGEHLPPQAAPGARIAARPVAPRRPAAVRVAGAGGVLRDVPGPGRKRSLRTPPTGRSVSRAAAPGGDSRRTRNSFGSIACAQVTPSSPSG